MRFSPYLGVGGRGGLPRGLGHNLLMQFFRLGSSKMENSKTDFVDILTIQNDQISYAKHVVAPLYAFFTLFGCLGGGRAPKRSRAQPTYAAFPPEQLKKRLSLSPLRGALPKAIEFLLLGNSLLGSLVFTRYREPSKKKFFLTWFQNLKKKTLGFRTFGPLLGHFWATSDFVPRSEASGTHQTARVM